MKGVPKTGPPTQTSGQARREVHWNWMARAFLHSNGMRLQLE